MRLLGGLSLTLYFAAATAAPARAPADPVSKNIRTTCKSQKRCMTEQRAAMRRALNYLGTARPPGWRLQICNKNASRGQLRVDWVGFDNCIRNASLRPAPPPRKPKRRIRIFS